MTCFCGSLALHGDRRFVARERQAALRVGRRHPAFEHSDEGAVGLDADEKLRALDGGVDKRRLRVQRSWLTREEEDGAPDRSISVRPGRRRREDDPLGVLIDDQPRVVDENNRRPAALAGSNRVAEADVQVDRRRRESGEPTQLCARPAHRSGGCARWARRTAREHVGVRRTRSARRQNSRELLVELHWKGLSNITLPTAPFQSRECTLASHGAGPEDPIAGRV